MPFLFAYTPEILIKNGAALTRLPSPSKMTHIRIITSRMATYGSIKKH